MTILKRGEPITNESGKIVDFKAIFAIVGIEGILSALQDKEPDLNLEDLVVVSTTQSSVDGVEKMQRLGIYDNPEKRKEYLELVKLGQDAENLMHNFLKSNDINKTYKGTTYDITTDCGFYVGNPEFPNFDKIPKKAKVIPIL